MQEVDGKLVLLIRVEEGSNPPYVLKSGTNKLTYIRRSSSTQQADDDEKHSLYLKKRNVKFDCLLTHEKIESYSFSYLKSKWREIKKEDFKDTYFESLDLSNTKGYLTNLGLLLADSSDLEQNKLICTRWIGTKDRSNSSIRSDKIIDGCCIKQLYDALDFLKNNTKVFFKKEALQTIENPDYSIEAIRECIVNAIVHRNYALISGDSEIDFSIFDDHIEITSFDSQAKMHIPENVTKDLPSIRRNPHLANIFHILNLMDKKGSGLLNITNKTNALFSDGKNHVFFDTNNGYFKVIIENANFNKNVDTSNTEHTNSVISSTSNYDLNEKLVLVLDAINNLSRNTLKEIAARVQIPDSTVKKYLAKLKKDGYIFRDNGRKKGSSYALTAKGLSVLNKY